MPTPVPAHNDMSNACRQLHQQVSASGYRLTEALKPLKKPNPFLNYNTYKAKKKKTHINLLKFLLPPSIATATSVSYTHLDVYKRQG